MNNDSCFNVLIVRIGKDHYAIEIQYILEIVPVLEIRKFPDALPFLEGYTEIRGLIYTIIDLSKRFGQPRDVYLMSNRIILHPLKGRNLGFIVDEVIQVVEWNQDQLSNSILSDSKRHFTGVIGYMEGREVVQTIDLSNILSEDELLSLSEQ